MVVGDQRKYLTCLITLKCQVDEFGNPKNVLDEEAVAYCKRETNEDFKTVDDLKNSNKILDLIKLRQVYNLLLNNFLQHGFLI